MRGASLDQSHGGGPFGAAGVVLQGANFDRAPKLLLPGNLAVSTSARYARLPHNSYSHCPFLNLAGLSAPCRLFRPLRRLTVTSASLASVSQHLWACSQ